MEKMSKASIEKYYEEHCGIYTLLGKSIENDMKQLLNESNISFYSVTNRIKEKQSFLDKIDRKGYDKPKEQIEDFCGIRIICYYQKDLKRIEEKVINAEFDVKESIDKTKEAGDDKFGYRSNHYIVTIKKEWLKSPAYRSAKDLKIEVQVRTILMHSWADIEHKLAYKSEEQVPTQLRRKLSQLSALLELADEQFQLIKNERDIIRGNAVKQNEEGDDYFDLEQPLNFDTLKAYLNYKFPEMMEYDSSLGFVLSKINKIQINFNDIDLAVEKSFSSLKDLADKLSWINNDVKEMKSPLLHLALSMENKKYWDLIQEELGAKNKRIILEYWEKKQSPA